MCGMFLKCYQPIKDDQLNIVVALLEYYLNVAASRSLKQQFFIVNVYLTAEGKFPSTRIVR